MAKKKNILAVCASVLFLVVTAGSFMNAAESKTSYVGAAVGKTVPFRIDLNTATEKDLCFLPDIGPETARKIIEDREINDGFSTVTDLTYIYGIGKTKVDSWREFLCVS